MADDIASDRAVAKMKRARVLRRVRAGRFWHRIPFDDRPAFDEYLREHLRFVHRADWSRTWSRHREWRTHPLELVRAVRFELLEPAD